MRFLRIGLVIFLLAGTGSAVQSWVSGSGDTTTAVPALRIEVLNGCGEPGLAQRMAERLQGLGQDVVRVGDAPAGEHPRTVIVDRRGRDRLSRGLARRIGPCPVVLERIEGTDVDLTLIVGADWPRLRVFSAAGPV